MLKMNAEVKNILKLQEEKIKSLEKEIKKLSELNSNLIRKNKYKTEFFSNISHELKTPISIILGAIQLIERKGLNPEDGRRNIKELNIIKVNCYRLLRLVNNILDMTRIDSGYVRDKLSNCNIVYLVEEITQSTVPYAEQKNITVEFDTECEEIITAVYVDKIERIILNLLSNAIKFTPEGGRITVRVSKKDKKALISVKDTGPGIPRNVQKDIFKRFYQVGTDSLNCKGSGIGLSLVKSFVELHKGSIKVISKENKGSEFIVELPIKPLQENKKDSAHTKNEYSRIVEAINIEFSDMYSPSYASTESS